MPLPDLNSDGFLPPGIHAASLRETLTRYGDGSQARQRQGNLLRLIVEAAQSYPTIKRVLVWGSFVTAKPEPNDLDYSVVVGTAHEVVDVPLEHKRFFDLLRRGGFMAAMSVTWLFMTTHLAASLSR